MLRMTKVSSSPAPTVAQRLNSEYAGKVIDSPNAFRAELMNRIGTEEAALNRAVAAEADPNARGALARQVAELQELRNEAYKHLSPLCRLEHELRSSGVDFRQLPADLPAAPAERARWASRRALAEAQRIFVDNAQSHFKDGVFTLERLRRIELDASDIDRINQTIEDLADKFNVSSQDVRDESKGLISRHLAPMMTPEALKRFVELFEAEVRGQADLQATLNSWKQFARERDAKKEDWDHLQAAQDFQRQTLKRMERGEVPVSYSPRADQIPVGDPDSETGRFRVVNGAIQVIHDPDDKKRGKA